MYGESTCIVIRMTTFIRMSEDDVRSLFIQYLEESSSELLQLKARLLVWDTQAFVADVV